MSLQRIFTPLPYKLGDPLPVLLPCQARQKNRLPITLSATCFRYPSTSDLGWTWGGLTSNVYAIHKAQQRRSCRRLPRDIARPYAGHSSATASSRKPSPRASKNSAHLTAHAPSARFSRFPLVCDLQARGIANIHIPIALRAINSQSPETVKSAPRSTASEFWSRSPSHIRRMRAFNERALTDSTAVACQHDRVGGRG